MLILSLPNLVQIYDVISNYLDREKTPRVIAGSWMKKYLSLRAFIASDFYTYVPPDFKNYFHTNYLAINDIIKYQPDYIVSSREISQRFIDEKHSKTFAEGESAYMEYHILYKGLQEGTIGYYLLKDFSELQIYARSNPRHIDASESN